VAQSTLQRSGQKLAESAEKIKDSTYRVEDSAERTTQLAADGLCRRTHLRRLDVHRALGSGERYWGKGNARGLTSAVVDHCHRQRPRLVQRLLFRRSDMAPSLSRRPATANRCVAHPALDFNRREWISRARGARCSRRHLVRPSDPTGLMPPLRGLGDGMGRRSR
jgi:hypothetical protein